MQALHRTLRHLTVLALALPLAALAATPITGVVTNRTTDKPAAGDTVTLIRLAQGMQEATHTTTDARGHYTLEVPDDGLHLVRVTHDKANYFQPAPAGTTSVDIDVYNAAPKVKGVSTEAAVLRIQTDASGSSLHVVENFFVKNESKPAMTQFSAEPFDLYLPAGAVIEGSAALAPGGMPVQAAPIPLAEKNKYTFLFPIRPGETRFQITYHVPYSGNFVFDPKMAAPTDTIALMLPKSMTFTPAAGSPYNAINDEVDAQTYVARGVKLSDPTSFTLSGKGELPRDSQNTAAGSTQSAPGTGAANNPDGTVSATNQTAPGKGLDNPLDPEGNREPLSKYKWWILSGLAVLLVIAAAFLLRRPTSAIAAATTPVAPPTPQNQQGQLLQVIKDQLFALETDRLQNKLSAEDYAEQKAALETVLRRALRQS